MFLLKERWRQKYRTLNWPVQQPQLPPLYRGKPRLLKVDCGPCRACMDACPAGALSRNSMAPQETPSLDMGRCIFCGACAAVCPKEAICFSKDYHLAAKSRSDLVVRPLLEGGEKKVAQEQNIFQKKSGIFGRSFKLRQVSAGGCNACEADCNVLGTLVYDLGRFGVEFTASPRHADGIVLTGPISRNMEAALLEAWQSVPEPRVLIAVGVCAISGGLFRNAPECLGGMDGMTERAGDDPGNFMADVYIPGCPPNPWTILEGLLLARGCR